MVCGCYLATYSDFFHESILFKSRNFDYDCDTSTLNIKLARFCQLHEAVVEQMLKLLLLHNIAIAKIFDRGKFLTSARNSCIAAAENLV